MLHYTLEDYLPGFVMHIDFSITICDTPKAYRARSVVDLELLCHHTWWSPDLLRHYVADMNFLCRGLLGDAASESKISTPYTSTLLSDRVSQNTVLLMKKSILSFCQAFKVYQYKKKEPIFRDFLLQNLIIKQNKHHIPNQRVKIHPRS